MNPSNRRTDTPPLPSPGGASASEEESQEGATNESVSQAAEFYRAEAARTAAETLRVATENLRDAAMDQRRILEEMRATIASLERARRRAP